MTSFWHKAAAQQGQARCDGIQAEFRRDAPPLPPALVPTDDPLLLRVGEELDYARRMLDIMGDELSSDGLIVSRHLTSLQSVDVVGQVLGHIADVIRSSDPEGAVDRIGMADLKARLTRTKID